MEELLYLCNKCGISKPKCEMIKDRYKATEVKSLCRACRSLTRKAEYEKTKEQSVEKTKLWNKENKEYLKQYQRWYLKKKRALKNGEIFTEVFITKNDSKDKPSKIELNSRKEQAQKRYRHKHRHHLAKKRKTKEYRDKVKNRVNLKRKNDINFKLLENLRCRIKNAIIKQAGEKSYKTIELLGCSVEEARKHIESLWLPGMTWENHGKYEGNGTTTWNIDHIIPCNSFNLLDHEEQKKCFNYKNLQPLWAKDNLYKRDTIIHLIEGIDFQI